MTTRSRAPRSWRSALDATGARSPPCSRSRSSRAPALGTAALRALDLWASGSALPNEARANDGTRVDLEAVLAASEPAAVER